MNVGGHRNVVAAVVASLVLLVAVVVVAMNAERRAAAIACMAVVPLLAAFLTGTAITAVVAVATVVAAVATAGAAYGQGFADALPVLVVVIAAASVAIVVSRWREMTRGPRGAAPRRSRPSRASAADAAGATDTDPVTTLPSRAGMLHTLEHHAPRGPRVIALIDIDGLAGVNAAHGRDVGDVVLFAVGGRTRYALDEADIVGRWDEDQLLLLMPGDMAAATPTLTFIADKINANPIRTEGGAIPAAVSIGAATWSEGSDFDDAFARARDALREARDRGDACLVTAE